MADLQVGFQYNISAEVRPLTEEEVPALAQTLVTAGLDEYLDRKLPVVVDGKPRMLHVQAWIAHEGFNGNGDGFLAEELKVAVEDGKLFKEGFAGIIDLNHDFQPRGYWYNAQYAFDQEADKWGILAQGAVWAWLFPELVDYVMSLQSHQGNIEFSLEGFSNRPEMIRDTDGSLKRLMHDPVFAGASLLDQTPADPHGRGFGRQDGARDGMTDKEMQELLLQAALKEQEENKQMEEILQSIKDSLPGMSDEVVAKVTASVTSANEQLIAQVANNQEALTAAQEALEAANTRITELEGTVEDKDLQIASASEAKESLEATLDELQNKVTEFEAAEEARAREARAAERLAEVPENVTAKLSKEERERHAGRWAELSDEEWQDRLADFNLAAGAQKPNGRLPNAGGGDVPAGIRSFIKSSNV